jgi:hypothetical protein
MIENNPKYPPLGNIYPDSSVLWASGWPSIEGRLPNLLSAALELRCGIFVPEVVELELEQRWLRECNEAKRKLESFASRNFIDSLEFEPKDRLTAYRKKVHLQKERWGMPQRSKRETRAFATQSFSSPPSATFWNHMPFLVQLEVCLAQAEWESLCLGFPARLLFP